MQLNVSSSDNNEQLRIDQLKLKASAAILKIADKNKQANMMATGLHDLVLLLVLKGVITLDELSEQSLAMMGLWNEQINPIRASSNQAEQNGLLPGDYNP